MKKMFCMSLIMLVLLSACGESATTHIVGEVKDQIANVAQLDDPHVLSVKNATPHAYPNQTYGEAFENFFGSPTWKYFVGTKEASDEDGDGEPDSEETDVDIVEFTGYCMYGDVDVKARIQFTLNQEDNTFRATYLSFNDIPQNMLMLHDLIETVFSDNAQTEESASTDELPDNDA